MTWPVRNSPSDHPATLLSLEPLLLSTNPVNVSAHSRGQMHLGVPNRECRPEEGCEREGSSSRKEPSTSSAGARTGARGWGRGCRGVRLLGPRRLLRGSGCPQPKGQLGRGGGQERKVLVPPQPPGCGRRDRVPGAPEPSSGAFLAVGPGPRHRPSPSLS